MNTLGFKSWDVGQEKANEYPRAYVPLTEISQNRRDASLSVDLADVLIVCCDGLTGFPDAIEAIWPKATVQTCVVHLIRNAVRYVTWKDRKQVCAALKPIYTAPSLDAAADALDTFEIEWGNKYPAVVDLWRRNWERFVPFLTTLQPWLCHLIGMANPSPLKHELDVVRSSSRTPEGGPYSL